MINERILQKNIEFLSALTPHAKLEECSKAMLFMGPYAELKSIAQTSPLFILDNVNYNRRLFEDPLPLSELIRLFEIEPGYGSITGEVELGSVVRALEYARAKLFLDSNGLAIGSSMRQIIDDTRVIITSGATGGINTILNAILARDRAGRGPYRKEIVFNVPCYCLPDAFARFHGLISRPVAGTREAGFLPYLKDLLNSCGPNTLACMLTYPNNPAQSSWTVTDVQELLSLIEHCQDLGIFLVVDNIFQDLRWNAGPIPEVFSLARYPDFLCKVFSPSKDRPFACGYRIGYVMTSRELEPWAERVESLANNSCNTISRIWLAFDAVFRRAQLEGALTSEMFQPFEGSYVFGYAAHCPHAKELHDIVEESGLYSRYISNLSRFMATIDNGLEQVWCWLRESRCFEVDSRPPYGNTLVVRVRQPFAPSSEEAFFLNNLISVNVVSLVGSCFGLERRGEVWFRIVMAGASAGEVISALQVLERFLITSI